MHNSIPHNQNWTLCQSDELISDASQQQFGNSCAAKRSHDYQIELLGMSGDDFRRRTGFYPGHHFNSNLLTFVLHEVNSLFSFLFNDLGQVVGSRIDYRSPIFICVNVIIDYEQSSDFRPNQFCQSQSLHCRCFCILATVGRNEYSLVQFQISHWTMYWHL